MALLPSRLLVHGNSLWSFYNHRRFRMGAMAQDLSMNNLSLNQIIQTIASGERRNDFVRIVAIDGPAGSGKTMAWTRASGATYCVGIAIKPASSTSTPNANFFAFM